MFNKKSRNIKKRILTLFILIVMMGSIYTPSLCSIVMAANDKVKEIASTPTTSNNYTYTTDASGNATITAYTGNEKNITIPEKLDNKIVTTIAQRAFQNKSTIETLNIPGNIKKIERFAFDKCTNLKEVVLSEGLVELQGGVFRNTNIKSIKIPLSLNVSKYIDSNQGGPFDKCASLATVTFSNGITAIPEGLFAGCTGLKSITIPNGVKTLGAGAFRGCTNLTTINFGTGVKEIGNYAFSNCSLLERVQIPGNVQKIGRFAFDKCTNLKEVVLSEGLSELQGCAFRNTGLKSIKIPLSLKVSEYVDTNQGGPFDKCANLVTVTFSNGITAIPKGLFAGCTGLKNITIPNSVKTVGIGAFRDCTGLTAIKFGTGVNKLEKNAFANCSSLKKVEIPGNIQKIDQFAFDKCTNLQELVLSEGLTELQGCAFRNTKIRNINIPASLKVSGWVDSNQEGPFDKCANLSTATFQNGITEIPMGIFAGCTGLQDVTIPDSAKIINSGAFRNCTNLINIKMGNSIEKISDDAFEKCSKLEMLYLPKGIKEVKNTAFNDSNIRLYADKYSDTVKTIIDKNWNIDIAEEEYEDSNDKVIVKKLSNYTLSDATISNGYLSAKIKYSIKSDKFDKITDKKIEVRLPSNTDLHTSGVKLNSVNTTKYSVKDGKLIIPVEEQTGEIAFCLVLKESSRLQTYAELTYKKDNTSYSELFDVIIDDSKPLTISVPQTTSENTVEVMGIAPKGKEVNISVEGQSTVKVTSSTTNGKYTKSIKINNSISGIETKITATTQGDKGEKLTATTSVIYNTDAPVVKSFKMNYQEHGTKTIELLDLKNDIPTLYYNPIYFAPSFELEVENSEEIDKLYVVSTRDGIKKSLEAKYDESTNKFYASGYFDPQNKDSYVPGSISYEYTLKKNMKESKYIDDSSIEDTPVYKAVNDLSSDDVKVEKKEIDLKKSTITDNKIENIINKANIEPKYNSAEEYIISFLAEGASTAYNEYKMYKTTMEVKSPEFEQLNAQIEVLDTYNKCRKYFTKDGNGEQLAFNVDISDPYSITTFVYDVTSNKLVTYTLQATDSGTMIQLADVLEDLSPMLKVASNYYKLDKDKQELLDRIYNSGMSSSDMDTAYKCANRLDTLKRAYFIFSTTLLIMEKINPDPTTALAIKIIRTASDGIFGFMFNVAGDTIAGENAIFNFVMNNVERVVGCCVYFFRWLIDPSGYVYEAVPSNRLEGVKTTLYYKENKNANSVQWNASLYNQQNPLYTDRDGTYSWDVPEGLWQVKYEKEGYETVYSEWLPVPPPQTEVNVGLISKAQPKILYVNIYEEYIEIKFDKYMQTNTLTTNTISVKDSNNKETSFKIEYVNAQVDNDGKLLANEIILKPTNKLQKGSKYTVTVDKKALSYAGTAIKTSTNTKTVQSPCEITVDNENISLEIGQTKKINITVKNLTQGTIKCTTTNALAVINNETIQIKNGKAELNLKGNSNGNTLITLQIENTGITKKVYVNCGNNETNIIDIEKDNISLSKNSSMQLKAKLYPITLEQKFEYESSNKNVITVDKNGLVKAINEGNAIVTISSQDGKTIKKVYIKVYIDKNFVKGDVNGDGKVSTLDYGLILSHVKKTQVLTGDMLTRADVNGDKKVSTLDYALVLSHVKKTALLS